MSMAEQDKCDASDKRANQHEDPWANPDDNSPIKELTENATD